MTPALTILGEIALSLYILFGYLLLPPAAPPNDQPYRKLIISVLVIVVVLVCWFVLPPLHFGN